MNNPENPFPSLYSQVIDAGLILPKKEVYTLRDANKIVTNSLFKPFNGQTITLKQAAFIVKCSAFFWDTRHTKAIAEINKTCFI